MPAHPALDEVINAPLWPDTFGVMQTSLGCTVGRRVSTAVDDEAYEHYEVIAAASNLPLSVCRAALCAPRGDRPLEIK
jgi:hypothetical protein